MYKVPLTNSPNQSFKCIIPVNGNNIKFKFNLWYNYSAKYWLITAVNLLTGEEYFSNLPLLTSYGKYSDILHQLDYKGIGCCIIVPMEDEFTGQANDQNIGKTYIMIWGDNGVVLK